MKFECTITTKQIADSLKVNYAKFLGQSSDPMIQKRWGRFNSKLTINTKSNGCMDVYSFPFFPFPFVLTGPPVTGAVTVGAPRMGGIVTIATSESRQKTPDLQLDNGFTNPHRDSADFLRKSPLTRISFRVFGSNAHMCPLCGTYLHTSNTIDAAQ